MSYARELYEQLELQGEAPWGLGCGEAGVCLFVHVLGKVLPAGSTCSEMISFSSTTAPLRMD